MVTQFQCESYWHSPMKLYLLNEIDFCTLALLDFNNLNYIVCNCRVEYQLIY